MRNVSTLLLPALLLACAPKEAVQPPATPKEEPSLAQEQSPASAPAAKKRSLALTAAPPPTSTISHRIVRSVDDVDAAPPSPGSYRIHLIDVGTGLAVLIQGADFNFLFDGGSGDDKSGISATENNSRLLAYLWEAVGESGPKGCKPGKISTDTARAEKNIGTVILGHPHEDHGVFLDEVLRCYEVDSVYDSGRMNDTEFYGNFLGAVASEQGVTYRTASAPPANKQVKADNKTFTISTWGTFAEGEEVALGQGASFKILHADAENHPDPNENSIVVRVNLGGISLLLTSDAESGPRLAPSAPLGDIEKHLVENYPQEIDVDILQVGHHGSMSSSRRAFLDAVSPQWALIGAGPKKYQTVVLPDQVIVDEVVEVVGDPTHVLITDTNDDEGCPVADRIGNDNASPGGCDSHILEISSQACCKTCSAGKACGDSCISAEATCNQPPGCACDAE